MKLDDDGADVGIRPLKAKAFFGTPAGNETVHRTVSVLRIALFESLSLQQKQKVTRRWLFVFGADVGIRTPEASLKTYTISNRAPSASSDTSANIALIL